MYYSGNFSQGNPVIEGADEDREGALALLLRLLGRGFPMGPGENTAHRVVVGKLPDVLPVAIPLPDGARVLGSLVHGNRYATVVLDADQTAEQVLEFYRQRLRAEGWTVAEQPGMHGGFAHSMFQPPLTFCRGSHGPSLAVQATAIEGGPADVRLNLNNDPRSSPCGANARRHHDIFSLIPTLTPPLGSEQSALGGSGGDGSSLTNATLHTSLDLAAIVAHYSDQLTASGWTQRDAGQEGLTAWSAWTFRDEDGEEWRGLFYALRRPGLADQYLLCVRVEWVMADTPPTRAGWVSTTG